MTMLYAFPDLDLEDASVLEEILAMRTELSEYLSVPRRWTGRLRRTALAAAIRGSNSIEGYRVDLDDADAALDDEQPLSADQRTFAAIRGYRQALGFVLAMAGDEHFRLDASALRSMHFMMLSHDLSRSPGQYRPGGIFVRDNRTDENVYTGPPADDVPALIDELVSDLNDHHDEDPVVQAAMAHLNLVMIHPFRDGNGRMARALQTMVLALKGIAEPEFASIEEWLGENTDDYYRVLAITGRGGWSPEGDAHLWVKFNLRAHHLQAQAVYRRWDRALRVYSLLDDLVADQHLPERVVDLLYTALLGYRLRRPTYVDQAGIDVRTASRDFRALTDLGLLRAVGETKGRYYVRGDGLELEKFAMRPRKPLRDPYPWMPARLVELAPQLTAELGTGLRTD
jgi:Fic family protein